MLNDIHERNVDVLVIGAGVAGLSCATRLLSGGVVPLVLEARARVGGRVLSSQVTPDLTLELGARKIGRHHSEVQALCAEHGIALVAAATSASQGPGLLPERVLRGGSSLSTRRLAEVEAALACVLDEVRKSAGSLDLDDLSSSSNAACWDAVELRDWSEMMCGDPVASDFINDLPRGAQSAFGLIALASAGGPNFFSDVEALQPARRLDQLPRAMASALGSERILLLSCVNRVNVSANGYEVDFVRHGCAHSVRARAIVVAVPPPSFARFGREWAALAVRAPSYVGDRFLSLTYTDAATPLPDVLSDEGLRLVTSQRVTTSEGERLVVEAMVRGGTPEVGWSTERLAEATSNRLGLPDKLRDTVSEMRWQASSLSRGTYAAYGPGRLAAVEGQIWKLTATAAAAGDWTCPGLAGFMEGAVRSGHHAAEHVLSALH